MKGSRIARSAGRSPTKGNMRAPASSPSLTAQKQGKSQSASTADSTTYQVADMEWLPIGQFKTHVCCDCGLAHKIKYRIHEGIMQEQWTRSDKETKSQRRPK
jgi:hypothetical protein